MNEQAMSAGKTGESLFSLAYRLHAEADQASRQSYQVPCQETGDAQLQAKCRLSKTAAEKYTESARITESADPKNASWRYGLAAREHLRLDSLCSDKEHVESAINLAAKSIELYDALQGLEGEKERILRTQITDTAFATGEYLFKLYGRGGHADYRKKARRFLNQVIKNAENEEKKQKAIGIMKFLDDSQSRGYARSKKPGKKRDRFREHFHKD